MADEMLTFPTVPAPVDGDFTKTGEVYIARYGESALVVMPAKSSDASVYIVLAQHGRQMMEKTPVWCQRGTLSGASFHALEDLEVELLSGDEGSMPLPASDRSDGALVFDSKGEPFLAIATGKPQSPWLTVNMRSGVLASPSGETTIYNRWRIVRRGPRREDDQVIAFSSPS